jgi:hypothetical protein
MNVKAIMIAEEGQVVLTFVDGLGLVMGRVSGKKDLANESVLALNDPRIIQNTKNPETGKTVMKIFRVPGYIERLYLPDNLSFLGRILDKGALEQYRKSTSSLHLPGDGSLQ